MTEARPPDADHLLRVYLQDHHAGSAAGVALTKRMVREHSDLEPLLGDLEREITEDQQSLMGIMSRLDVEPSWFKSALGTTAELVARLKGNGRIMRPSPSSRVVELEGLAAGVATKRNLWRSLLAVADDRPELDRAELELLEQRASSQIQRLEAAHRRAAAQAFAPPAAVDGAGTGGPARGRHPQ
jgi:hypothetical protein